MADNNVSIQDIKKMANDVDAGNADSVNKFLSTVDEKFKNISGDERAAKLNFLTSELENRGVLPQLLVTAGMADYNSEKYMQMKESNGWDLKKDDLENMSKNGKKGFFNVDAAAQFLAGSILRNFDGKAGISQEYSGHTFGISDGKIDYKQIRRWAEREGKEADDRRGLENALLQWDSIAKKLESDKPKRDDLSALLKADKFSGNKMLSKEERDAAQFMMDKWDTLRSIDNSSFRPYSYDDWISKGKLEYWGNNKLHTSAEDAASKKAGREQLVKDQTAQEAKDKEKIAAAKPKEQSSDSERVKQLEEQLRKQQELIEKLIKLQEAAQRPPAQAEKPPAKPPEQKPPEQKPPAQVEKPPVKPPEQKPPAQAEKPPVKPPEQKPPVNWADEEEKARRELEQLLKPPVVNPPVKR